MKKIFYITLLLFAVQANAQKWTAPVAINPFQGVNNHSDFCIDHSGNIHCVWSYKIASNYRHIYYSKSTNDGLTWSSPKNISENNTLWMDNPHIVADSKNNLHVTYDYNTGNHYHTLIVHRKFSDNAWGEIDTISPGWPGARHNRLVIDHNDKLYCFWFHEFQNGTTFYRILENGIWGEIEISYDNNDLTFFKKGIVDDSNNIRCTGAHHYDGESGYEDRVISFDFINGKWSDWTRLSDDTSWGGNDIALSSSNKKDIVWGQYINDLTPPDNGTLYAFQNGENWTAPILLAEKADEQAICVDIHNQVHIVDNEKLDNTHQLVHYRLIDNEWVGSIIEENMFGNYSNKLISRGNYLYLVSVSVQSLSPNYNASIVLRKHKTSIDNQPAIEMDKFNVYPNPVTTYATISYSLEKTNYTSIKIYDLQGKLINTIIDKTQAPGKYEIMWNGTDKNKKEVNSGLYLVRLQAGRQFITRSVEIIK